MPSGVTLATTAGLRLELAFFTGGIGVAAAVAISSMKSAGASAITFFVLGAAFLDLTDVLIGGSLSMSRVRAFRLDLQQPPINLKISQRP